MLAGKALNDPTPVDEILAIGLNRRPNAAALVSHRMEWTWEALAADTDRLAGNLLATGLRPGDRIASLLPNRGALLLHYIACIKAGLVAVPLNYRYMSPEIDHALKVSGASLLVAHAERAADLAASAAAPALPLGIAWFEGAVGDDRRWEDLVAAASPSERLPAPVAGAPAFIFFTSGSTGPAKGVTHTRQSLRWMIGSCARAFEMGDADVVMPASSISHLGGFLFSLAALSVGARVVITHTFDPPEVLRLLRENRPTVLCMLPAALFSIVRERAATRADFASLRLCRSGSDKVPSELEREFSALTGFGIDEGYGCTEAGLITLNPPSGVVKAGSIGRAAPGFDLSIRDDAGDEVAAGADGRLWVRTRSLMAGYWNDAPATAETMRDSWFDTGDVMRADNEGYLTFRGRKKQIIIHDGSNICPQEVEEALLAHPAVECAGVVGVRDLLHGEEVHAYVAVKKGMEVPTAGDLIELARARIGYKAPEHVEFLAAMPLNPTGKVDRVKLKRMAAEGHVPASAR